MSASAADTIMSVSATISFVLLIVTCGIGVLVFGIRLAEKRVLLFPATSGHLPRADHHGEAPTLGLHTFVFDRRLPAAAASGIRRVAREAIVSADGAITINLTSPSRREIEICLVGRRAPSGAIAVIRVMDESGDHPWFIPLVAGSFEAIPGYSSGIAMVPTTARTVEISQDVKLLSAADLDTLPPEEIARSVHASTGRPGSGGKNCSAPRKQAR